MFVANVLPLLLLSLGHIVGFPIGHVGGGVILGSARGYGDLFSSTIVYIY
jgi:hypothetical protein